ncbi:hypothetical protein [Myxococcus dinghuensis]|uniref:hypothetical protein n=1 Tax=Myxococcus dinghuensis TaxID=2906761 RepID=UPI00225E6A90|nr:hypothetical protein [Myxococcus dinghuensis]
MAERSRVQPVVVEVLTDEASARRQLEGRVELIESVLRETRELEALLRPKDWRWRLFQQHSLVTGLLEREAALPEALERTERRAQLEGWPKDAPILKVIRTLRLRRERLARQVTGRLESLSYLLPSEASLEQRLRLLEQLHQEEPDLRREPTEPFSLRIDGRDESTLHWGRMVVPTLVWLLLEGVLFTTGLSFAVSQTLVPGLVVSVLFAAFWSSAVASTSMWITPSRLVWIPRGGRHAVALRLEDVRPESARLVDGRRVELSLVDGQQVQLPRPSRRQAERLRVLLTLFSAPELREQAARVSLPVVACVFPAMLRRHGAWSEGQVVLLHRGVYFFPGDQAGRTLLRNVAKRDLDGGPVPLDWVLEGLLWQTEVELDAMLVGVANALGGAVWPAEGTRVDRTVPLEQQLHLTHGEEVIAGPVPPGERDATARIVNGWR